MSRTEGAQAGFRFTAFGAGLTLGVATLVAIPALLYASMIWLDPSQPFNIEVLVNGADLSRHRAARLTIEDSYDGAGPGLSAICRGGCDSYGYRQKTGESSHIVKVLDAQGAVIVEEGDGYVDHSVAARLTIAGKQRLVVRSETSVRGREFRPWDAVLPKTTTAAPDLSGRAPAN